MSLDLPCIECGARNFSSAKKCYLCGAELKPIRPGARPQPLPTAVTRGPLTYSLSTLFLIVALAGVCFGLIATAPGLGIPVAVLVAPAFIRTLAEIRQQKMAGEKPRAGDKIGAFFESLSVTVMAAVPGTIAFGAAFFAASTFSLANLNRPASNETVWFRAFGAATLVALAVGIPLYIKFWPRRGR